MRLKILNSLTNSNLIEYDKFEEYYFFNFLYNSDMSNFDYLSHMLARVQGVSIMYLFCSHRRQTSVGQVAVSELRFSFSNYGHETKSIRQVSESVRGVLDTDKPPCFLGDEQGLWPPELAPIGES